MLSKREKVLIAVLASLLLHGLILLLFGFTLRFKPAVVAAAPEEPVKLEIEPPEETPPLMPTMPLSQPPAPFVDNQKTDAPPPTDPAFQSNENSQANGDLRATGAAPVPTQQGKKIPEFTFDTKMYTLGDHPATTASAAAQSQPPAQPPPEQATPPPPDTPPPQQQTTPPPPKADRKAPRPQPTVAPTPERLIERDEFAMLGPTPTPHPLLSAEDNNFDPTRREPPTEPPRPTPAVRRPLTPQPRAAAPSGYQPMTQKAAMDGSITNRGSGPVNVAALGTPMGRYKKAISDAIGSRWYYYIGQREDVASFGTVKIHFVVDSGGKVRRPQVLSNTGNSTLENISLEAILDASIPPIPPEVCAIINSNQMDLDFSFALVDF